MGLLSRLKLPGSSKCRELPHPDQQTYLRQIQSDEPAEREMAKLHLPEAYVFGDNIRISPEGIHPKDDDVRRRQAVFYELGRLTGFHPRFDTCDNLAVMLENGEACPPVLYDSSGTAPSDKWVIPKGDLLLCFSGRSDPHIVYKGDTPTDDMILDMESAAAANLRIKASWVLERLCAGAYETELPDGIWEMCGRHVDRDDIYRLVMEDAPEGDDPERERLVFYGREMDDVAGFSADLAKLAEVDRYVSAWLDAEAPPAGYEVPLYDLLLQETYAKLDIGKRVAERKSGMAWEDIWTGDVPGDDVAARWRL